MPSVLIEYLPHPNAFSSDQNILSLLVMLKITHKYVANLIIEIK